MPAGPASLCTIPRDLLLRVTQHLSPLDQRNVFLTCPQLYSNWKIQLRDSDHKLQLLTLGLQYLENIKKCPPVHTGSSSSSDQGAELQCFSPDDKRMEGIKAGTPSSQHFKFRSRQLTFDTYEGSWPNHWHAQTSCQILHRLTASPDLTFVRLKLSSTSITNQTRLQELARTWFSSLVSNKGFLRLQMTVSAAGYVMKQDELKVVHWNSQWTIDGVPCRTAPPILDFDNMPSSVSKVEAQLYSANSTWTPGYNFVPTFSWLDGVVHIPTEAQYAFAYLDNVDVAALVCRMRRQGRAHAFYRDCACSVTGGALQRCEAAHCVLADYGDLYVSIVLYVKSKVHCFKSHGPWDSE